MSLASCLRPVLTSLILGCGIVSGGGPTLADEFTFHREEVMGTSLELVVRAASQAGAERAEARVLREIQRLSDILSGYDPASAFRRWHDHPGVGPVAVSAELFEVLQASDRWRERTGGAFDPRVAGLARVWSAAATRNRLPAEAELAPVLQAAAGPAWKLDALSRTAERLGNAPITLDAIAKGYIVERACRAALDRADGVTGALLNVGGDLRLTGDLTREIGIAPARGDSESTPPVVFLRVAERAVATSGDAQRGHTIAGRWYSHILDPATGRPAQRVRSATVVAPRSDDADALATALNVLEPAASLALVRGLPGVECRIVAADGSVYRSEGWNALEVTRPVALLASAIRESRTPGAESPDHWGDESEVALHFELNRPTDLPKGYRRPYVAAWVENGDGLSVRTLAMWVSQTGAGPFQWLPDLKRWFAADRARKKVNKQEVLFTVARPTRPPGKYSVVWDGKDDSGKPLPPGDYTICLDVAREHGTYQHLQIKVSVGDQPFDRSIPDASGTEIRAASVEYRTKGSGR
ncbi:MAG: DUF2271 domain-containing protein [Isosphaeraceae bacterium]